MRPSPPGLRNAGDIVGEMDTDFLTNHWALLGAAVPAMIVLILVLRILFGRTANGQLRRVLHGYREAQKALAEARKTSEKCRTRVEKLTSKAGKTKPRTLQEAREAAEDAISLEKIADDKLLVAANHVRHVIHEEFPPVRQQKLRDKYLPQDNEGARPYSFK